MVAHAAVAHWQERAWLSRAVLKGLALDRAVGQMCARAGVALPGLSTWAIAGKAPPAPMRGSACSGRIPDLATRARPRPCARGCCAHWPGRRQAWATRLSMWVLGPGRVWPLQSRGTLGRAVVAQDERRRGPAEKRQGRTALQAKTILKYVA